MTATVSVHAESPVSTRQEARQVMASTALLTGDDLDEIGCSPPDADQAPQVVAELVEAVERGLVADPRDTW